MGFKGQIPWNKGKRGVMPIPWNKGKENVYSSGTLEKMRKAKIGKKQSREVVEKRIRPLIGRKRPQYLIEKLRPFWRKDSEHPMWKGENADYHTKHKWVNRKLGRPQKCELCETINAKRYEWANISKEYKRDLADYIRLCVPCHKAYDLGKITI